MSFYQFARPETMKAAGRYLALLSAIAVVFFLWECFFHSAKRDFEQMLAEYRHAAPVRKTMEKPNEKIDMIAYEEIINNKSIFQASPVNQTPRDGAEDDSKVKTNPFQNVSLVGILPGDTPQAILEDLSTQQNFYLSAGESWNNITVEKIQDGAVILTAGTEKKKLTL